MNYNQYSNWLEERVRVAARKKKYRVDYVSNGLRVNIRDKDGNSCNLIIDVWHNPDLNRPHLLGDVEIVNAEWYHQLGLNGPNLRKRCMSMLTVDGAKRAIDFLDSITA